MSGEKSLDEIKKFWPKEVPDIKNVPKYIKKYKKDLIVIKYGGSAMLEPKLSKTFYKDIEILVTAGVGPSPEAESFDGETVRSGAFPSAGGDCNVVPGLRTFLSDPKAIPLLSPVWEIVKQGEQQFHLRSAEMGRMRFEVASPFGPKIKRKPSGLQRQTWFRPAQAFVR